MHDVLGAPLRQAEIEAPFVVVAGMKKEPTVSNSPRKRMVTLGREGYRS
jgi:hypothetical protein